RHPAVDEHAAREQHDWRRRPEIQIEVHAFGQDVERIDDWCDEEPRVRDHFPDLVQVTVAHEQHARAEREAGHDREEMHLIQDVERDVDEAWRAAGQDQKRNQHDGKESERDDRVRGGRDDDDPRREPRLGQQIPFCTQRQQSCARRLLKELVQKQADDQIELVLRFAGEDVGKDRHQHQEHRQRFQQGPYETADRAVVAGDEICTDECPNEPAKMTLAGRSAHRCCKAHAERTLLLYGTGSHMTSLRILHVVPYYQLAWAYGGIPRVATTLTQGLARRGHQVTVYTTDACDER